MCYNIDTIEQKEELAVAVIEEIKKDVIEIFEKEFGLKAKTAWLIGARWWQVEAEDGYVYNVRW